MSYENMFPQNKYPNNCNWLGTPTDRQPALESCKIFKIYVSFRIKVIRIFSKLTKFVNMILLKKITSVACVH